MAERLTTYTGEEIPSPQEETNNGAFSWVRDKFSSIFKRREVGRPVSDLEGEKSRSVSNPCVPVSSYDGVNRTNGGHFPEQEIGQETQGVNEHMKEEIEQLWQQLTAEEKENENLREELRNCQEEIRQLSSDKEHFRVQAVNYEKLSEEFRELTVKHQLLSNQFEEKKQEQEVSQKRSDRLNIENEDLAGRLIELEKDFEANRVKIDTLEETNKLILEEATTKQGQDCKTPSPVEPPVLDLSNSDQISLPPFSRSLNRKMSSSSSTSNVSSPLELKGDCQMMELLESKEEGVKKALDKFIKCLQPSKAVPKDGRCRDWRVLAEEAGLHEDELYALNPLDRMSTIIDEWGKKSEITAETLKILLEKCDCPQAVKHLVKAANLYSSVEMDAFDEKDVYQC